jgi:hypothetical protein
MFGNPGGSLVNGTILAKQLIRDSKIHVICMGAWAPQSAIRSECSSACSQQLTEGEAWLAGMGQHT